MSCKGGRGPQRALLFRLGYRVPLRLRQEYRIHEVILTLLFGSDSCADGQS